MSTTQISDIELNDGFRIPLSNISAQTDGSGRKYFHGSVAHIRTMDEIEARDTAHQRFQHAASHSVWIRRFADGGNRYLWSDVLLRTARTQELGIRMALGAQASNLRNMVIRQGTRPHRSGYWNRRSLLAYTFSGWLPLWSQDAGSDRLPREASGAECRCPSLRLDSCETGYSC
jgi:hypothetical protein